jgi:hypothetical protein
VDRFLYVYLSTLAWAFRQKPERGRLLVRGKTTGAIERPFQDEGQVRSGNYRAFTKLCQPEISLGNWRGEGKSLLIRRGKPPKKRLIELFLQQVPALGNPGRQYFKIRLRHYFSLTTTRFGLP